MAVVYAPPGAPESPVVTLGDIAARFGCSVQNVRRLFQRGLLPEPARVGPYRVVAREDVPKVEEALRAAGYIPEKEDEAFALAGK